MLLGKSKNNYESTSQKVSFRQGVSYVIFYAASPSDSQIR